MPTEFDRSAFRFMTLAEAAMAWRAIFGRKLPVDVVGEWPSSPGFVAVGGHFGAGIAALWALHEAGMRPRFVLHPPDPKQLHHRPLGYIWSRLRFRLVRRLCPDGPITTPGARATLERELDGGHATPVVLLDTPDGARRDAEGDWALTLGRCRLPLRTGARVVLESADVPIVFFWARASKDTGRVSIEVHKSGAGALTRWPMVASRTIAADPAQWQFWPFIGGALRDAGAG